MNVYDLPRNVKGEGRILFIFTPKSLIYTAVSAFVGVLLYLVFKMSGFNKIGIGCFIFFALVGFVVGTCKVPGIVGVKWMKKNAGQRLDDVAKRAIDFKRKGKKIYIYEREEETDDK